MELLESLAKLLEQALAWAESKLVVVIVVVVIVLAFWWRRHVRERHRSRAMRRSAVRLGLSFAKEADLKLQAFKLLPDADRRDSKEWLRRRAKLRRKASKFFGQSFADHFLLGSTRNVIHGQVDGINVKIFGYVYSGVDEDSSEYAQTVAMLDAKDRRLPNFQLSPEGVFDRIGSAFGAQDIDFDSHPAFSSAYVLKGDDEQAIRECFTNEVLDYLQKDSRLHVEASGNRMIYYRDNVRVEPQDMRAFLDEALALFRLFPAK